MKIEIILSCLLLFNISKVVAQEVTQEPPILSFNEAVKIALEHNVTLNTQRNQLYANEAQRLQSYGMYLPSVGINNASLGKYSGQGQDPNNGDFVDLKYNYLNASIGANYIIFNGLNRQNTLRRFENQFMAQTSLVDRAKQDAIFNVGNQYMQVMFDQELLKIAEENYAAQTKLLDQIREYVDLGARPPVDLYNQDALAKTNEVAMIRARVNLQNDKSLLAQLLQLDPSQDFRVALPDWAIDQEFVKNNDLENLYTLALTNRSDLKQAEYQIKANRYSMRAATSGYMPIITAFGQYGSQYASVFSGTFDEQFTRKNPNLTYGLNVGIPLFDRFVTRTNRVVAKVALDNSVLLKENLEKSIKIDVQRSFRNYQAAIDNFEASQALFLAGELALKTQRESYEVGIASQVTLALANQTYVLSSAAKAQAEVTLTFQKILLEYALGVLNVDALGK